MTPLFMAAGPWDTSTKTSFIIGRRLSAAAGRLSASDEALMQHDEQAGVGQTRDREPFRVKGEDWRDVRLAAGTSTI